MAIERQKRPNVRRARPPGQRRAVLFDETPAPSEWRNIWVAIFGFYILFAESGVRQVMNGFVEPVILTYNCTKNEADTAVLVIPMASSLIFGPLCSMFYQWSGARVSIIVGASLAFTSFVVGPFCKSIYLLMVCTLGLGTGCGLMRNSIISIQCEYFKKKRNTVMAAISIGPGLGIFVLPRTLKWIMVKYGSWGPAWWFLSTFYIVSAIMALFISKQPSEQTSSFSFGSAFKVCKKIEFDLHLIACFFASSVSFIYLANILILMASENIEDKEGLYGYQGLASIFGKFVLTFIMSLNRIHNGWIMLLSYVIAQFSLSGAYLCYKFWHFRLQNAFAGIGIGLYQACLAPFLVAIVGPSQLAYALGFTNLINGISIISGVWLSGFASKGTTGEDARSAFFVSFWLGIAAIIMSAVTSLLLMAREKHKRKPSMKQMKHSPELNTILNINSVENS
uniref:Major facilitator superfamily (MFS) profile domain-containing protein n=1 Tax=Caenorhabditis japonica TaxID=281687 RepID=A0A8R1HXQ2_CAEJA